MYGQQMFSSMTERRLREIVAAPEYPRKGWQPWSNRAGALNELNRRAERDTEKG